MVSNPLTVFTKPWPDLALSQLAEFVAGLGLDGVELPVRPGYQVTPENVGTALAEAVHILNDHGLRIGSVAGNADEEMIHALGECGIPLLRICVGIDMRIGYMATEKNIRRQFDALLPSLDAAGVAIGVQNHCDFCVGSAIGIMHLIEQYDPRHICAVLDMAHCAVDGEPEAMAIDIVWSHLRLVNFKSAFHMRINGPEAEEAEWAIHWATGRNAGYSWRRLVGLLKEHGYSGDLCLPAEYSAPKDSHVTLMGDAVEPMLKRDIAYLKELLSGSYDAGQPFGTDWQSGVGNSATVKR